MKPRTLYDIYADLIKKRHFMGITCFRVRDVDTCMDYLICSSEMWEWDYQNMPKMLWAVLLEPNFNSCYPMSCNKGVYALLSSQAELDFFKAVGNKLVQDVVRESYESGKVMVSVV